MISSRRNQIIAQVFLFAMAVLWLLPIFGMVVSSFRPYAETSTDPNGFFSWPETLTEHTDRIMSAQLDPSERFLASGGNDYSVRLFDLEVGSEVATLKGHGNTILDFCTGPCAPNALIFVVDTFSIIKVHSIAMFDLFVVPGLVFVQTLKVFGDLPFQFAALLVVGAFLSSFGAHHRSA